MWRCRHASLPPCSAVLLSVALCVSVSAPSWSQGSIEWCSSRRRYERSAPGCNRQRVGFVEDGPIGTRRTLRPWSGSRRTARSHRAPHRLSSRHTRERTCLAGVRDVGRGAARSVDHQARHRGRAPGVGEHGGDRRVAVHRSFARRHRAYAANRQRRVPGGDARAGRFGQRLVGGVPRARRRQSRGAVVARRHGALRAVPFSRTWTVRSRSSIPTSSATQASARAALMRAMAIT